MTDLQLKPAQQQYRAYGLNIFSDRPLPACLPTEPAFPVSADLHIQFDTYSLEGPAATDTETLWYSSYITDSAGVPALKIWKDQTTGHFSIRYSHGLTFQVDSHLSSMIVYGAQGMSDADVASFLLGPVLGILLRLKGFVCLHGSGVNLRGRAVVFVGAEGCGKSTTAAAFAQRGHSILTDDIAVLDRLDRGFFVRPAYPALNLFPDSVTLLYGSPDALPPADPAVQKQQMMLGRGISRFETDTLPLGSIFVLTESAADRALSIQALSQKEGLVELAANTYANRMLDISMRESEFKTLGALVNAIPVFRLTGGSTVLNLEALYEGISTAAEEASPA